MNRRLFMRSVFGAAITTTTVTVAPCFKAGDRLSFDFIGTVRPNGFRFKPVDLICNIGPAKEQG